ncbi:MAG: uracil-DNA glycosylase [Planctomycetota bacterium]|nr:uracil-DNA glycosylase [Planctomycetota bacterium]
MTRPPDPRLAAEALLYLEWARGAGTRYLPAATPPPAVPVPVEAAPAAAPARPQRASGGPRKAAKAGARPLPKPILRQGATPSAPDLPPAERDARLASLKSDVVECRRCKLCAERSQTVFGEGSSTPRLAVVGEAPGAEEDRTGRPFVGRAGQLLTKMLGAIGLAREDVFIMNVLKCRPPQNRNPRPDEVAACRPYLHEQLEILRPDLILALGSPAVRELLRTERGITSLRGRFAKTPDGWRVMPTYHPAYLLRNPAAKREAWHDLQRVAAELGLEIPPRN